MITQFMTATDAQYKAMLELFEAEFNKPYIDDTGPIESDKPTKPTDNT